MKKTVPPGRAASTSFRISDTLLGVLVGGALTFAGSYFLANYESKRQEQLTLIKDRFDACLGLANHFAIYAESENKPNETKLKNETTDDVQLPDGSLKEQSSNEKRRQATFDTARVISECYADKMFLSALEVQSCIKERLEVCDMLENCTPNPNYTVIDETGQENGQGELTGSINRAC